MTLPPTGKSGGGAPVSDPAFLVRARAKAPCRRPALQSTCGLRQLARPRRRLALIQLSGPFFQRRQMQVWHSREGLNTVRLTAHQEMRPEAVGTTDVADKTNRVIRRQFQVPLPG